MIDSNAMRIAAADTVQTLSSTRPVVGLDLSLTGTGIAIVEGPMIHTALIGSKGKADDTLTARAARLDSLKERITNLIPGRAFIVVEQPSYGSTTGSQHDRSGLWWLIMDWLHPYHQVTEVAPGTLKKYATGKGNAGKDEMLSAAIRRYPDAEIRNNNVADAMHLAAMGSRRLGNPLDDDTVKILEAMATPLWSDLSGDVL